MADQERIVQQSQEGSPWFWKIFGSAIMGIISILLITHITNINNNIDRMFFDLRSDLKDIRGQLDRHRDKMVLIEQSSNKEKIPILEKAVQMQQVALDDQKQKTSACEAINTALKEELKNMREWNKEINKQLQEVRLKQASGTKP